MAYQFRIRRQLGHAHVSLSADRRHALAGAEDEYVAVEQRFFPDGVHGRQRRHAASLPIGEGISNLIDFHFQPPDILFINIADADGFDDAGSQKAQADEHGHAHVSQG